MTLTGNSLDDASAQTSDTFRDRWSKLFVVLKIRTTSYCGIIHQPREKRDFIKFRAQFENKNITK